MRSFSASHFIGILESDLEDSYSHFVSACRSLEPLHCTCSDVRRSRTISYQSNLEGGKVQGECSESEEGAHVLWGMVLQIWETYSSGSSRWVWRCFKSSKMCVGRGWSATSPAVVKVGGAQAVLMWLELKVRYFLRV